MRGKITCFQTQRPDVYFRFFEGPRRSGNVVFSASSECQPVWDVLAAASNSISGSYVRCRRMAERDSFSCGPDVGKPRES